MKPPKEYAEAMVNNMWLTTLKMDKLTAKKCALLTVQYIINANPHSNPLNTEVRSTMDFWEQVKTEIINLK